MLGIEHRSALAAAMLAAAAATQAAPVDLGTVVVKGQALSDQRDQPYTVSRFTAEDIRERQLSQTEQLFREVPGMEVRGLGYDGVANSMSLRGFSGGGHGGDIGFVIDGIPLNEASSHADGYGDLNVIVPLELAEVTVFKGPVSALYGNFNRAGVVALRSRQGGDYREADLRLGSHGTADLQGALGTRLGAVQLNAAAQLYRTDGYRPGTGSQRATLALRAGLQLAPDTRVALSARLHRADADTASVITQEQYERREGFFARDPRVQNDGADKRFATLRADLVQRLAPDLTLLAFAYGTDQRFNRYFTRPTNAIRWQQRAEQYDRSVQGFGLNLNGEQALLGAPLRWVAGLEHYGESTGFRYADALQQRAFTQDTLTAGVDGGSGTLDRRLRIRTRSAFGQAEWVLHPLLRPTLGLRHDRIAGGCERRSAETRSGASAQCAAMPDFAITTPKLGLRSSWWPGRVEARASLSEGFALPGDAAKFTPGLAVEPTRLRQHEFGVNLKPAAGWSVDLAHFRVDSRDEVALVDATTLRYANVGRTRRSGLEAAVRWQPGEWLEASAALARIRTRVLQSLPATPHLVGAELTGVPRSSATVTLTLRPAAGTALTLTGRDVGRQAITQPGATTPARHYGGYRTLDLMLSHEIAAGRRLHAQLANATDSRHAGSSSVTGGLQTYNPAPPRTLSVGAALDF